MNGTQNIDWLGTADTVITTDRRIEMGTEDTAVQTSRGARVQATRLVNNDMMDTYFRLAGKALTSGDRALASRCLELASEWAFAGKDRKSDTAYHNHTGLNS